MPSAVQYYRLAEHLRSMARIEDSQVLKAEWEHLAACYVKLAEQADRDAPAGTYQFDAQP